MKDSHTPGPWHFIEVGPLRQNGPRTLLLANKTPFVHGTCEGLSDADCNLIAAAPDMLAFLKDLKKDLDCGYEKTLKAGCGIDWVIQDILKKVEGN